MNRNEFRERFEQAKKEGNLDIVDLIDQCLALDTPEMKRQITMEEAAELSIECSKMNRGLGDRLGLLEEMADIYICLSYLCTIHDVDYEEICYAVRVKLLRYLDKHGPKGENKSET